jgi:PAB1-binding protein PBP1
MKQTAVEWLMEQLPTIDKYDPYYQNLFMQAKAMEKEQMCSFAEFVATYPDKNININGEMLHAKSKYDGAERTIDLLKEYYESNT